MWGIALCGLFAVIVLLNGCGGRGVDSGNAEPFAIVTVLETSDGVIAWDPNVDPVLYLAVSTDVPPEKEQSVLWKQAGLQLTIPEWYGPILRLHIDTPGCGYGGHTFNVTAELPGPGGGVVTVTIDMARYICPGSPWLVEDIGN